MTFAGLAVLTNGLLGGLLTFRLLSASSTILALPSSALLGAALCLISGLTMDPGDRWPRWSCSCCGHYFLSGTGLSEGVWWALTLSFAHFGAVSGYLNFCRSRIRPENNRARFHLLMCLAMLAGYLWIRAGLDYARFSAAMKLRLTACAMEHNGRVQEAIPLLVEALATDPNQREAAGDLAELYVQTGEHELAVLVVTRELLRAPRRPRILAQVFAQRGRILLRLGKMEDAYRDFRAARRWAPHDSPR